MQHYLPTCIINLTQLTQLTSCYFDVQARCALLMQTADDMVENVMVLF